MGLDTVELIIRVEEHFGIEIPNAEAAKLETVGRARGEVDLTSWWRRATDAGSPG
jgi:acyl carrier protein